MLNGATCFKNVYIVTGYTDYPRSMVIRENGAVALTNEIS